MGESTRIISQDGIEDTLLPVPHFLLPQIVGVERLSASEAVISSILDERIELESLEDFEDFDEDIDLQEGINLEITLEHEENAFDADFVSDILNED